jgi:hypothetical protein
MTENPTTDKIMTDDAMTEKELDQLLTHATRPALPEGFAARLRAKLEQAPVSNVIAFPQRKPASAPSKRVWISAIPLAASLLIGIYLGTMGSLSESVANLNSTFVADGDSDFNIGIEDTESFINGELS